MRYHPPGRRSARTGATCTTFAEKLVTRDPLLQGSVRPQCGVHVLSVHPKTAALAAGVV